MNRLDAKQRTQIISALVEGASMRAVSRMTGKSQNTVAKLLLEVGAVCAHYQDVNLRNLTCKRIQCDEIWSFVGAKDKNVAPEDQGKFGIGSVWTWTALDADTKLICSWLVAGRDGGAAYDFMSDLQGRLANRVQLTTDGHSAYLDAVGATFGNNIDYAMLIKKYGAPRETEARYSPADCMGTQKKPITGSPDKKHVSTSYVERQNLTMRMHMRRSTRLTNAFSKKIENHIAAVALHFMYYNFVRIHQTLRVTPAMAAGVTDRVWEIGDIVTLLEQAEISTRSENRENSYAQKGPALGF